MERQPIYAITSLSADEAQISIIRNCISSWLSAGLEIRSFNHPSEISALTQIYDVEFVPVLETTLKTFGKHYIPINVMYDWAAKQNAAVLLINSDIHLKMAEWEIKRIRWLCDRGLCYFMRYNYDEDIANGVREQYGIDAYFFKIKGNDKLPHSFLSMGQPFWDYWLPHTFAIQKRPIYAVEYPAAFHRNHMTRWSWENWYKCALEFARITEVLDEEGTFEACVKMSLEIRKKFESRKITIFQRPFTIKTWVQEKFNYGGPKIFFEIGAHKGTDTAWLSEIPDVFIHAFEPDPRNNQTTRQNVAIYQAAIAEREGRGLLIQSLYGWGQEWTHSSSIKKPKNHLKRYPVTFGESIEIKLITLDGFCKQQSIGLIDFVWADVQGAEGEMIIGGRQTFKRTRYLYTEYSDDEMYENQATLGEIMEMLPGFRVIELWSDNVLLENENLKEMNQENTL
jgi:FkbM family methyltransferase